MVSKVDRLLSALLANVSMARFQAFGVPGQCGCVDGKFTSVIVPARSACRAVIEWASDGFVNRIQKEERRMSVAQTLVRVGESVCGRGVFACKMIRQGLTVGAVSGRVIDDPLYGNDYTIDLGGDLSLDPDEPFRFLNHCCDPNCQLVLVDQQNDDGTPAPSGVELISLRTIAIGEELTIDYAWNADDPIPCRCGSTICRGWIIAAKDAPTRSNLEHSTALS